MRLKLNLEKKVPRVKGNEFYPSLPPIQEKLPKIEKDASGPIFKNDSDPIDIPTALQCLKVIDTTLKDLKQDAEEISENQYECKLEIYKQEIIKTVELIFSTFDYVLPNIRFELKFMEKYYRAPANMGKTVMPELNDLVHSLDEHHITLDEFFKGYKNGENKVQGYNVLRMKNGLFSKYQFFDNSPDAYKELNDIHYQVCKFMEFSLKDKRSEPDLGNFIFRSRKWPCRFRV